ncbi:unnamed protein product [Ectocarpus sp. 12 AP-2014]
MTFPFPCPSATWTTSSWSSSYGRRLPHRRHHLLPLRAAAARAPSPPPPAERSPLPPAPYRGNRCCRRRRLSWGGWESGTPMTTASPSRRCRCSRPCHGTPGKTERHRRFRRFRCRRRGGRCCSCPRTPRAPSCPGPPTRA